eukprot:gene8944-10490_t
MVTDNAGALQALIKAMASDNDEEVREHAVRAIGVLVDHKDHVVYTLGQAADLPHQLRDTVLASGVLQDIIRQFDGQPSQTLVSSATLTLANLCRGKPAPKPVVIRSAIPALVRLIGNTDDTVVALALCTLSCLTCEGPNEYIQTALATGISPLIIELLAHQSVAIQHPALRTIGNIATGNYEQSGQLIKASVLTSIHTLMSSSNPTLAKEACWTLSNFIAGSPEENYIQAAIDANVIPLAISLLASADIDTKKEIAWTIINWSENCNKAQMDYLVNQGCIPPFSQLLNLTPTDPIVQVVINGIENILFVGNEDPNGNQYLEIFQQQTDTAKRITELRGHLWLSNRLLKFFNLQDPEE